MSEYAFCLVCVHSHSGTPSLILVFVRSLQTLETQMQTRMQTLSGSIIRTISDAGLTPKPSVSGLLHKYKELKRSSSKGVEELTLVVCQPVNTHKTFSWTSR